MRLLPSLFCLALVLHCSYAPPVVPEKEQDSEVKDDLAEYMEYHRYLKEVVQALESDPDFRERLEKADEDDVRSGKIAEQLDFVNHNVRSKLDEIKRRELDRLRHLATKQYELTNELNHSGKVPTNEHVDQKNPHTFEVEDLKKLIQQTTRDLEAADKKRKEEFKEYEMQKEFEKHQKLEELDEAQKKEYEDKIKQEEDAKKKHKPLHHPVTRDQLLEIWKNADKLDEKDFDPKVFFMVHDVDGNGVWDADEVKALFIKELDKIYGPAGPNKDLYERAEEMERMREHVFKENDKNRDGLIDFAEFMAETQKADFSRDEGWKSIDENEVYSQQEYQAYERRRLEEIRYLQQLGLVDAHARAMPGAHHQIAQARQTFEHYYQQYHQPPPVQMPQGHPQQFQAQYPAQGQYQQPGQYHAAQGQIPQGQIPQGQYQQPPVQGQIPQGQYQQPQAQGQIPQGQYQQPQAQGQIPQGQYQQPHAQGQIPQGQYQQPQAQGQIPQGQYQQPQAQGQIPQGQYQQSQPQGQIPQGQYQPPQGQFQQPPQGQFQPSGQPIQQNGPGQFQGQHQPQGQPQGKASSQQPNLNQAQSQGQAQGPAQNQAPQTQQNQGQAPPKQAPQSST